MLSYDDADEWRLRPCVFALQMQNEVLYEGLRDEGVMPWLVFEYHHPLGFIKMFSCLSCLISLLICNSDLSVTNHLLSRLSCLLMDSIKGFINKFFYIPYSFEVLLSLIFHYYLVKLIRSLLDPSYLKDPIYS